MDDGKVRLVLIKVGLNSPVAYARYAVNITVV